MYLCFYSEIVFCIRICHYESVCSRVYLSDFGNVIGIGSVNENGSFASSVNVGMAMAMESGGMVTGFFENGSLDLARESEFDASAHPEIFPSGFLLPTLVINLLVHLGMAHKSAVAAYYPVYDVQKLLAVAVLLTLHYPLSMQSSHPESS